MSRKNESGEKLILKLLKEGYSPVEIINLLSTGNLDALLLEWPKFKKKTKKTKKTKGRGILDSPGEKIPSTPKAPKKAKQKDNVPTVSAEEAKAIFRPNTPWARKHFPKIQKLQKRMKNAASKNAGRSTRKLNIRYICKLLDIVFKPLRGKQYKDWPQQARAVFKIFVVGLAARTRMPSYMFNEESPFYGKNPSLWDLMLTYVTDFQLENVTVPNNFSATEMYHASSDIFYSNP